MKMPNKKPKIETQPPIADDTAEGEDDEQMEHDDDSEQSSSSDDDDSANSEECTGNEIMQVNFEGRSPMDPDCHGISQLLSRLFLKAHINCMQLADLIIGQNYVGSVIAQCELDDEEDDSDADDNMCEEGTIFGITTILNLTAKKDVDCIQKVVAYVLERAEKHATDAVFKHFLEVLHNEQRHVGFLINERFINIPVDISVPLLEALDSEIEEAKQKRMKFDFANMLMIVKFYRKESKKGDPAEDLYTNPEEEVICKQSTNAFEFSVAGECDMGMAGNWLDGEVSLTPYRKVVLFDAKQLPQIKKEIKDFISEK